MTLDDLERQNRGISNCQFRSATHISRANCTEIDRDRQGQAVYEIFIIERRFQ